MSSLQFEPLAATAADGYLLLTTDWLITFSTPSISQYQLKADISVHP